MEVREAEVVALLGPNGAGKSTLLALLAGGLEPSWGSIERRAGVRIGWTPQRPAHYGRLSPRENLELFADLEGEAEPAAAASRLLGQFELPDAPRPSARLSVGNRQRLNLAISLLGNPDVLLLDEPTASLDPPQRRKLWQTAVQHTQRGGAVVFATQNHEELEGHADVSSSCSRASSPSTARSTSTSGRSSPARSYESRRPRRPQGPARAASRARAAGNARATRSWSPSSSGSSPGTRARSRASRWWTRPGCRTRSLSPASASTWTRPSGASAGTSSSCRLSRSEAARELRNGEIVATITIHRPSSGTCAACSRAPHLTCGAGRADDRLARDAADPGARVPAQPPAPGGLHPDEPHLRGRAQARRDHHVPRPRHRRPRAGPLGRAAREAASEPERRPGAGLRPPPRASRWPRPARPCAPPPRPSSSGRSP